MLPIPDKGSVEHLEENVAAATVELSEQDLAELSAVPRPSRSPRRLAGSLRRRLSR